MTIEVLEPWATEHNDFLVRFLETSGEGVHHVTFKVDDVEAELERLRSHGIEPVAIDFRDPGWREMFIHPRDSHGTLIQIAQPGWKTLPMDRWLAGLPATEQHWGGQPWWDRAAMLDSDRSLDLVRMVIATPDVPGAAEFYGGLLGAAISPAGSSVDCRWDGGTIRVEPSEAGRASVARLEVTGAEWTEQTIAGTRFVAGS
jgi:hypothetical protein